MNNIFFLEIFNEVLKINNSEITIIYESLTKIWFGLRDIIKALGYNNYKKAIKKLKINKEYITNYKALRGPPAGTPLDNAQPHKKFINEAGIYQLLSISNKPLAKVFMDKYFQEIMPKIRQNGEYILNSKDKNKLDNLNP
jgi:prophage antirepressor-like protein